MSLYKLKTAFEDLIVCESMVLPLQEHVCNKKIFHYFRLIKKGYSTFDAIILLADHFNISKQQIGYAGLKDEDGITEQHISFPTKTGRLVKLKAHLQCFERKYAASSALLMRDQMMIEVQILLVEIGRSQIILDDQIHVS